MVQSQSGLLMFGSISFDGVAPSFSAALRNKVRNLSLYLKVGIVNVRKDGEA